MKYAPLEIVPAMTDEHFAYLAMGWRTYFDVASRAIHNSARAELIRGATAALYNDFARSLEEHHINFDREAFDEASGYTAEVAGWLR